MKNILFVIFALFILPTTVSARPLTGGIVGGGGSDEARVFTKVAYHYAKAIEKYPSARIYATQLIETLSNVEVKIVDSLENVCLGTALNWGDLYAFSCYLNGGEIYLLRKKWGNPPHGEGWLINEKTASLHWKDIIHEVFRAGNPNSKNFVTSDIGYEATNMVLGNLVDAGTFLSLGARLEYLSITDFFVNSCMWTDQCEEKKRELRSSTERSFDRTLTEEELEEITPNIKHPFYFSDEYFLLDSAQVENAQSQDGLIRDYGEQLFSRYGQMILKACDAKLATKLENSLSFSEILRIGRIFVLRNLVNGPSKRREFYAHFHHYFGEASKESTAKSVEKYFECGRSIIHFLDKPEDY